MADKFLQRRFDLTIDFIGKHINKDMKILDLGIPNELSEQTKSKGYNVSNTAPRVDLDIDFEIVKSDEYQVVTAFEIIEHLFNPYTILKNIKADKLIASVPLNVWFSPSHWSNTEPWDCHYHEFEVRQFNRLLEKTGWKLIEGKTFKCPHKLFGIRPFLRRIYPSYYIVYCEKIKE
jgi:hypothetical protein